MPHALKSHAVQQLHSLWAQQTLNQFTASGSFGDSPSIFLQVASKAEGRYERRRNRIRVHTTVTMTRDEVVGITAHELGHWARCEIHGRYYRRMWMEIVAFACTAQLLFNAPNPFRIASPAVLLAGFYIALRWSRRAEGDADRTAAAVVGPTPILVMLNRTNWINRHVTLTHPRTTDRTHALTYTAETSRH